MILAEAVSVLREGAGQMLDSGVSLEEAESLFRQTYVSLALSRVRGNQSKAASMLSVHRNTIVRTIQPLRDKPRRITVPRTAIRTSSLFRKPTTRRAG